MKVKDIFPLLKGVIIINKIEDDRRFDTRWYECVTGSWDKKLDEHNYYDLRQYFECEIIEIECDEFDLCAHDGYGYEQAILITIKEV